MCVLGMCSRTLCFFPGDLSVELELICPFQNLQTGTHFASKLLVLITRYAVSASSMLLLVLCRARGWLAVGSPPGREAWRAQFAGDVGLHSCSQNAAWKLC